jgi:hypothetical protein
VKAWKITASAQNPTNLSMSPDAIDKILSDSIDTDDDLPF